MTLDLARTRELGQLFRDTLTLYFGNFGRFLAISAVVVIPTELIVSGVGLGRLGGGYDTQRQLGAEAITSVVEALVVTPLIVAMTLYVLIDLSEGRRASVRSAIQSGLDAFAPIFLPVLMVVLAEGAVVLVTLLPTLLTGAAALTPLLIVAVYLALRWYFVAQAVVVDGARGLGALRASWGLTRGFGWRVFGTAVLAYFGFFLASSVIAAPIAGAARSADSGAILLVADIVQACLAAPGLALISALLFFDLKARRVAT